MTNEVSIRELLPGTRTDIRILQLVMRAKETGEEVESYPSSIFDTLPDDTIEVNCPTKEQKIILLRTDLRYELVFTTENGLIRATGIFTERYKKDNFYLMKFKPQGPLEKYQRREFYRLDCYIPLSYVTLPPEADDLEKMSELRALLQKQREEKVPSIMGKGTILDISGGGIRFITTKDLKDVSFLLLTFPIQGKDGKEQIEVIGKVRGSLPLDKNGNSEYRIQILFKDSKAQERIVHYIFEEERRIRQKESGQQ